MQHHISRKKVDSFFFFFFFFFFFDNYFLLQVVGTFSGEEFDRKLCKIKAEKRKRSFKVFNCKISL